MTMSTRARALAMLARREHSRAELLQKLAATAAPEEDLDALLDSLEAAGYLSDARLAEQLVRRARGRHGPLKVEQGLRARGVTEPQVTRALQAAREAELEDALVVLRRRFPDVPGSASEWARRARYLQNRGFRGETIRQALRVSEEVGRE
ncbi:MAG: recombination regulator RecX [Betaproteobacteria bacterium]|nr:recombination regulator RecX [Betaproteobacteria bacterium]